MNYSRKLMFTILGVWFILMGLLFKCFLFSPFLFLVVVDLLFDQKNDRVLMRNSVAVPALFSVFQKVGCVTGKMIAVTDWMNVTVLVRISFFSVFRGCVGICRSVDNFRQVRGTGYF
jgi:hypothetical protein